MTATTFALLCFTTLFSMLNPLGILPIYNSIVSGMPVKEARKVAIKAMSTAAITMILFAFTGKFIFSFFGISADSFRVAGGILFFIMGYDMLQAKLGRMRKDPGESTDDYAEDVAITPLAIPMICGPGAITAVILLMQDAQTTLHKGILIGMIVGISFAMAIMLLMGRHIQNLLGEDGNKVIMRIMGLIVMVIAVESFFAGITPFVKAMLGT